MAIDTVSISTGERAVPCLAANRPAPSFLATFLFLARLRVLAWPGGAGAVYSGLHIRYGVQFNGLNERATEEASVGR